MLCNYASKWFETISSSADIYYTTTSRMTKQAILTYRTDHNYSHWKNKCQFFVLSIERRLNKERQDTKK